MNKRIFWSTLSFLLALFVIVLLFEESREFFFALLLRILFFVKKNILKILTSFFLVRGKFIVVLFMKKIALLSVVGLGKRYMIEKVFIENLKKHFLNHLTDDLKRFINHAKENFKDFSLIKKVITLFTFLASLGFIGKFMGGMLAVKVFIAKVWSFLLAIFLKATTAVVYFFTDYLWGSWLAPIVEVVLFSWLLSWMERVPFLSKGIQKIYTFFVEWFGWFEYYMEKIFHIPLKRFLKWSVRKIQKSIYRFIGYKKVSVWERMQEDRKLNPNSHMRLIQKRKVHRAGKTKTYKSSYERLRERRKKEKQVYS
ncbi:hypothetical protein MNB_SV-3-101 [hydrothermal vent metagenome]|uniref:Uncharacterized protein n=1 Tax=hydrothermal vent metagenome TaxID=652676 RepID=A0A1W1CHS7_9ZZZZ